MYILHYVVTSQENPYQFCIFPPYLKEHSLTMIHFFLKSSLTTSLQARSFLLLISPDILVTGIKPTETSFLLAKLFAKRMTQCLWSSVTITTA